MIPLNDIRKTEVRMSDGSWQELRWEQLEAPKYTAVEPDHFFATISLPLRLDHWYKQNALQPPTYEVANGCL